MDKTKLLRLLKSSDKRRCCVCGKMLKHGQFGIIEYAPNKFKFRSPCRVCENKRQREDRNRYKYRFSKHGITEEEYNNLYMDQGGACAICNRHCPDLFIDHCHLSGVIRGLLCSKCNSILGFCSDNINTLNNAIKYLSRAET